MTSPWPLRRCPSVRCGAGWRAGRVLVRPLRPCGAGRRPGCGIPAAWPTGEGCLMAFRKISYLIPACDGCGLAWSFSDPACAEGIPPHFATRAAALEQLPGDYGWQVSPRRLGRPLMACRTCSAAGVIPAGTARGVLLAAAGWIRRVVAFGPVPPTAAGGPRTRAPGVADRRAATGAGRPACGDRRRALPRSAAQGRGCCGVSAELGARRGAAQRRQRTSGGRRDGLRSGAGRRPGRGGARGGSGGVHRGGV